MRENHLTPAFLPPSNLPAPTSGKALGVSIGTRKISDKNKIKDILELPKSVSYPTVIEGAFNPQFLNLLTYLPAPLRGSLKNMKWAESDKAKRNRGNGQKGGNAE